MGRHHAVLPSAAALVRLAACLSLAACASTPSKVEVQIDPHRAPVAFSTYSLTTEEMPSFLVAFMRDAFVAALSERGARETFDHADVSFILRLHPIEPLAGAVSGAESVDGTPMAEAATRFMARVDVFAAQPHSAPQLIGSLSRVHTISDGVYMHPRAHEAIRRAFNELLAGFVR